MKEKIEQLIEKWDKIYKTNPFKENTWETELEIIEDLKSLQEPKEFSGEIEDFKSLWYKVTEKDIIELYKEKHLQ
jgi:hypothetical protein